MDVLTVVSVVSSSPIITVINGVVGVQKEVCFDDSGGGGFQSCGNGSGDEERSGPLGH